MANSRTGWIVSLIALTVGLGAGLRQLRCTDCTAEAAALAAAESAHAAAEQAHQDAEDDWNNCTGDCTAEAAALVAAENALYAAQAALLDAQYDWHDCTGGQAPTEPPAYSRPDLLAVTASILE